MCDDKGRDRDQVNKKQGADMSWAGFDRCMGCALRLCSEDACPSDEVWKRIVDLIQKQYASTWPEPENLQPSDVP